MFAIRMDRSTRRGSFNIFFLPGTSFVRKLLTLFSAALFCNIGGLAQAGTLRSDLASYNFMDVVADGSTTYALATQKSGGVSYTDPDGTVSYERNVYLLSIDSAGALVQSRFATLNSSHGALSVQGNLIKVFLNYKTQNGTYGMAGKSFTLDKSSLSVTASGVLFPNSNWGWYPKISGDDVEHFSFAGYSRYKNTSYVGSVQPATMASEYNSYQASHSLSIMPNSDAAVVDGIVARVVVPVALPCASKWTVIKGTLTADNETCSSATLKSDPSASSYSVAQVQHSTAVSSSNNISVKMTRLSLDNNYPMEVYFLGGVFAIADTNPGYYYFYESESHWSGWLSSPAITPNGTNTVLVKQSGKNIEAYVNGTLLGSFNLDATPPTSGKVSVFFKGNPAQSSSIRFSDFAAIDIAATTPATSCTGTSASLNLVTLQICLPTMQLQPISGLPVTYKTVLNYIPGSNPLAFATLSSEQVAPYSGTPSGIYMPSAKTLSISALPVGPDTYSVVFNAIQAVGNTQFVLASATPTPSAPTPVVVVTTETQTIACPIGQTGSIQQQRTATTTNGVASYGVWSTTSNSCVAATLEPIVVVTTETQSLSCPVGQTGSIQQQRTKTTTNDTASYGEWVTTTNSCVVPTPIPICNPAIEKC